MIQHNYLDGSIFHKRFHPKTHDFKYKFFMVDIDLNSFENLNKNKLFSYNSFNLFSFLTKDHFGKSDDFLKNVDELLNKFKIKKTSKMRFITLPRILGFVFNPISVLILFEENKPKFMFAEVHNYNGGRVVYPVELKEKNEKTLTGKTKKDMYVSPFFKRDGDYSFDLTYDENDFQLSIKLYEDGKKVLVSNLLTKRIEFNDKKTLKMFFKHTLLTFWVVTRTIYQSIKLRLKGLKWTQPIPQDQTRRI